MTLSFVFLAYSAYVVPMQLSFWAGRGACEPFPTLSFDLVVDTYFVVRPGPRPWSALLWARGRKDRTRPAALPMPVSGQANGRARAPWLLGFLRLSCRRLG